METSRSRDLARRRSELSPEKRALLAERLRGKTRGARPAAARPSRPGDDLAEALRQPSEPLVDTASWEALVEAGHAEARARWSADDLREEAALAPEIRDKALAYLSVALNRMGFFRRAGERYTLRQLRELGGVLPEYRRALGRWMRALGEAGLVVDDGEAFTNPAALPPPELDALLSDDEREHFAKTLPDYLRGVQHPLEFLIPGGSTDRLEENYTRSPMFRYCNAVCGRLSRTQAATLPKGRTLRVLEIGAGTGGTTVSLLPELPEQRSVYVYTDISRFFTDLGREKFGERYPFVRFAEMNVEDDPEEQGLPLHAFDWVVAAHVLHATRDLRQTLRHVRKLLAPGGVLLLLEETRFLPQFNFTMGFLPGFDRFEDEDLRTLHPLLDSEQWRELLLANGFAGVASFTAEDALPQKLGVDVLLARLAPAGKDSSRDIPRRPDPRTAPLSFAQERLWRFAELYPLSPLHNVCHAVRLEGELDVAALERALTEIVRRHESLRTRFESVDGRAIGRVGPHLALALPRVDLAALRPERREEQLSRLTFRLTRKPIDLRRADLLKLTLLRLEPRRHILLLVVHHIVVDGWSLSRFVGEMGDLYQAFRTGGATLPELPIQFGDFAVWQRQRVAAGELREQMAYWKEQLAGAPARLDLPFRRPPPPLRTFRSASCETLLPHELAEALRAFARQHQVTVFMVLLAVLLVVLHRFTGQDDVVVATPSAGRGHDRLEGLIGFFLNLLVLRADLSGEPTFLELLSRVRETALQAYSHQDFPFEKLVEELGRDGDPRPPFLQVVFNLPDRGAGHDEPVDRGGLRIEPVLTHDAGSEFELAFYAVEDRHGMRIHLGYDAELFAAPRMVEMIDDLRRWLEEALADPGKTI